MGWAQDLEQQSGHIGKRTQILDSAGYYETFHTAHGLHMTFVCTLYSSFKNSNEIHDVNICRRKCVPHLPSADAASGAYPADSSSGDRVSVFLPPCSSHVRNEAISGSIFASTINSPINIMEYFSQRVFMKTFAEMQ